MTPLLVFDIETVPDVAGIRRTHDLPPDMGDGDVLAWYSQQRRAATGNDFAQHALQKVVAIGCALREGTRFKIGSVGEIADPSLSSYVAFSRSWTVHAQLVSWNGSGFDLPVLHYRSMVHGVTAARYWDWGDNDREFRYNNYLARYHTRHLDLMDVLAAYQPRANTGLDVMARLCGFPGKLGMDAAPLQAPWRPGGLPRSAIIAKRTSSTPIFCTSVSG